MYDYSRLLGKIKERGYTLNELAKAIGMNVSTLSLKLNNKREFRQQEMKEICSILHIGIEDISKYFFAM